MEETEDPVTPLQEMAHTNHEIFACYVNAGFTRPEALDIIIEMIRVSMEHEYGYFGGGDDDD